MNIISKQLEELLWYTILPGNLFMDLPTSLPGMFDIIPFPKEDLLWSSSGLWSDMEFFLRNQAHLHGFREIRVPLLEKVELFKRSSGDSSDVIMKELYEFEDKGNRSIALRPEGTAGVVRAYLENNLSQNSALQRLFYIGPMFRYDRPQKGRYRQHHQFGVEAIGCNDPLHDAEIITFLFNICKKLGIKGLNIRINTLGGKEARLFFIKALKEYLLPFKEELSKDSQSRLEKNPLRILDSKDLTDQEILKNAPQMEEFLDESSLNRFKRVLDALSDFGVDFTKDSLLVRGLDYYNDTVFELTTEDKGSQSSLGGGGRYDHLFSCFSKQSTPCFGFGLGMERLIQAIAKDDSTLSFYKNFTLCIKPLGNWAIKEAYQQAHFLRNLGISVWIDFSSQKISKTFNDAEKIGCLFILIIGENESEKNTWDLKNLKTKEQFSILKKDLSEFLISNNVIYTKNFY